MDLFVEEPPSPALGVPSYTNTLDEALVVLGRGLNQTRSTQLFWTGLLTGAIAILVLTADIDKASLTVTRWMMNFIRVALTVFVAWCSVTAGILCRIEHHALLATKNALLIQKKWEEVQQWTVLGTRMHSRDELQDMRDTYEHSKTYD